MPQIKSNGIEIYYEQAGSGDPILLIPGYTCDTTFWAGVAEGLAKNFTVATLDNRDFGRSSSVGQDYDVADLATDTIALCKEVDLADVTVVGHSLGGAIAQRIAVETPQIIKQLVLANTFTKISTVSISALKSHIELRSEGVSDTAVVHAAMPWFYGPDFLGNADAVAELEAVLVETADQLSIETQQRQFRALCAFDSSDWVHQISVPTAVVASEFDLVVPLAESQMLASKIKGAQLTTVPGAGHALPVELPGRFAEIVRAAAEGSSY